MKRPFPLFAPAAAALGGILSFVLAPAAEAAWRELTFEGERPRDLTAIAAAPDGSVLVAGQAIADPEAGTREPALWFKPAGGAQLRRLPVDLNRLNSSWSWSRQFTSLACLPDGQYVVAATTGLFRIDATSTTDALGASAIWYWPWDVSFDVLCTGDTVSWVVGSFGSQSGYHFLTLPSDHRFLHWGSDVVRGYQILGSGPEGEEPFGFRDIRGFRATLPPVLFGYDRFLRNPTPDTAANPGEPYLDETGTRFYASEATEVTANGFAFVCSTDGTLYWYSPAKSALPGIPDAPPAACVPAAGQDGTLLAGSREPDGSCRVFQTGVGEVVYANCRPALIPAPASDGQFSILVRGLPGNWHLESSTDQIVWKHLEDFVVPPLGDVTVSIARPADPDCFFRVTRAE